jgi:transposase-like protein
MERFRWGDDPRLRCPHCGHDRAYYLAPKNGGRKTRTGKVSERRVWKCAKCRRQFSVLNGTIFHATKIELRTWLMVVFEMCSSKNGVSAREIERRSNLGFPRNRGGSLIADRASHSPAR